MLCKAPVLTEPKIRKARDEVPRGAASALPERRLLAEVLAQALRDLNARQVNPTARARLCREALAWFASRDSTPRDHWPFEFVCESLGIDPEAIRRAVWRGTTPPDTGDAAGRRP